MTERRFSMVPIIATILKVVAVLVVLFLLYQLMLQWHDVVKGWAGSPGVEGYQSPTEPVTGFFARFASLLPAVASMVNNLIIPLFGWALAESLLMLRSLVLGRTAVVSEHKE